MCNLHWCYTFCTGVTLFALVLHLNCTALSQSESSNFFMYIINILNNERKTSTKYLGIYLDEHLNWKTQIAHVQGKLTQNLGVLNQLRNYLNLKMLRQLYYALMCSALHSYAFFTILSNP